MYKNILICTDGSDLAQLAVDHGFALARSLGSDVKVLIVTEPFPIVAASSDIGIAPGPADFGAYDEAQNKAAREVLDAAQAQADKMGVAARPIHVANAVASDAIAETADKEGCDLIVMGSHGRSGLGRLFLGSQTADVLAQASQPVLVIRAKHAAS